MLDETFPKFPQVWGHNLDPLLKSIEDFSTSSMSKFTDFLILLDGSCSGKGMEKGFDIRAITEE